MTVVRSSVTNQCTKVKQEENVMNVHQNFMPNKPTTIREEYYKWYWGDSKPAEDTHLFYASRRTNKEIADWWLSKFSPHNTELVSKIEERQKLFNFIPQDKYGYKMVKATDLDIISLINQEK